MAQALSLLCERLVTPGDSQPEGEDGRSARS